METGVVLETEIGIGIGWEAVVTAMVDFLKQMQRISGVVEPHHQQVDPLPPPPFPFLPPPHKHTEFIHLAHSSIALTLRQGTLCLVYISCRGFQTLMKL